MSHIFMDFQSLCEIFDFCLFFNFPVWDFFSFYI